MSVPSFLLTRAASSEALQPAFKARKVAHDWTIPTSTAAELAEDQATPNQDTYLTLQAAAEFYMLQQNPPVSGMEPQMMDYPATAEEYLFPVTSQGESASLDAWLPNCQPEPSMYETVTAQQDLNVFQPLWPPEAAVFGPPNLESFSTLSYSQAPISGNLETMKQNIEPYQLPSGAVPPHEATEQPTIALPIQAESKGRSEIAQGRIIDEVLGTLRQMDYHIRATNRQHLADINSSRLA
ncbi:hypothetical protein BBK36DRAFT_1155844 [Trichoderma citrinoviride]|uniref:Uncharacterized protein n=1 Tax=Trichoderma citrinoviride TaxID=58853 RepID=A0A2T4BIW7_9HYPO|nr:hypothetical protein BBK36DRAFT_1155844 [Trichoderma citrinoviride]PTB69255.1 hypothetical protein BBK36DRAFT_1155844 [Trichoderma citrinoviride]